MDAERIIERNTAEGVVDEAAAVAVEDVDEAEDEAALVMEIEVDREWSTAETAALEEVEEVQEEVVEALR